MPKHRIKKFRGKLYRGYDRIGEDARDNGKNGRWTLHSLRNALRHADGRRHAKKHPIPDPKTVDVKTYGSPIPLNYGGFRHETAIIWATAITAAYPTPNTDTLFNGGDSPNEASYSASWAVKVCEGEQGQLLRIWADGHLVYQTTDGTGFNSFPHFSPGNIKFYPGSETQTVDPTIEADTGSGFSQAYRGTCYIVFKNIALKAFGDAIPEIQVEISAAPVQDITIYPVAGLAAPLAADTDNFVVSKATQLLYFLSNTGSLRVVRRADTALQATIDVGTIVTNTTGDDVNTNGRIVVEEGGSGAFGIIEPIYLFGLKSGTDSFIFRYGTPHVHNYATALPNQEETSGFVNGDFLYTADGTNGYVHCYNKATLARIWSRRGPSSGLEAGSFTRDNAGNVWMVWYDGGDPDTLYITRIKAGGVLTTTTINSTTAIGARFIAYDINLGVLVTGGVTGNKLCKLSAGNAPAILATLDLSYTCNKSRALFTAQSRFYGSFYSVDTGFTSLYRIRMADFTAIETIALDDYFSATGLEGFGYGALEKSLWVGNTTGNYLFKVPLNRYTNGSYPQSAVISNLCLKAGIAAASVDVIDLSANITGFAVLDRGPAAPQIEELLTAYTCGTREHFANGYAGIKIQFLRRNATSIVTIPDTKLGFGDGEPQDHLLSEEHTNEEDLPARVLVKYSDLGRTYSSNEQQAEFPPAISSGISEISFDFSNLVMTNDEAQQLAAKTRDSAWVEGDIKSFTLGLEYLYIEPEDVITVQYLTLSYVVRIETVELGANLLLECSGVLTDSGVLTSTLTGAAAPIDPPAVVSVPPSRAFLLDTPAMRDADGQPADAGFYAAIAPLYSSALWVGGRLLRSVAFGLSFETLAGFHNAAIFAVTNSALNTGEVTLFDSASTVQIQLGNGTFTSHTEAEIGADRYLNLCAIGSESAGWELIQFKTFTDNGDGTGTLSGMYRGCFGTEQYKALHTIGETVLLIDFDTPTIKRIPLPLSDRGIAHNYRAISANAPAGSAPDVSFTNDCGSLKPLAGTHAYGTLNTPAAGDWTILWNRRTRIGFDLQDYYDSAINEETENYELDIADNPVGPILRTISVGPGLIVGGAPTGFNVSSDAPTQTLIIAATTWATLGYLVGQWVDVSGFTASQNNIRFQVTAMSGTSLTLSNGSNQLATEAGAIGRNVLQVTPATKYTAAQQIADGGAKGAFWVRIYQLSQRLQDTSGATGRGFVCEVGIS